MSEKNLIVKVSEGLGNQFFMYANAYALSRKLRYNLLIDNKSGYYKKKDIKSYLLDNFNISAINANKSSIYDTYFKNIKKKFLMNIDKFSEKKSFIEEVKNFNKSTEFHQVYNLNLSSKVYIEGNYESEKYFLNEKKNLIKEFSFQNEEMFKYNKYYDIIKKQNNSIISIAIRTDRYSERINNKYNIISKKKSDNLVKDTIDYINRSIKFFSNKIDNPKYFLWSNNFSGLREYFPESSYTFIENSDNKILNDFYLLTKCKHFIVGPTTFHWWGAWLNEYPDRICIRPKNINQSNNKDFWPKDWILF